MGRSLKKGPFVNEKLLKAIEEMNAANEKKVIKTWSRPSTIFPMVVIVGVDSPLSICPSILLLTPVCSATTSRLIPLAFRIRFKLTAILCDK